MPVFELNNRFVLHRTRSVDIQSVLTHDFLTRGNKTRSKIYIFLIVTDTDVSSRPND